MADRLLDAYHFLPPSAGSAAATLRGLYLRWWRYGRESERPIAEAIERENWAKDRLIAWQQERMAFIFYRDLPHADAVFP